MDFYDALKETLLLTEIRDDVVTSRSLKALNDAGIFYYLEAVARSPDQIKDIPHPGKIPFMKLEEFFGKQGYYFGFPLEGMPENPAEVKRLIEEARQIYMPEVERRGCSHNCRQ